MPERASVSVYVYICMCGGVYTVAQWDGAAPVCTQGSEKSKSEGIRAGGGFSTLSRRRLLCDARLRAVVF